MTVTLPALSAHDPAASGEGSRDLLGLEAIAERLASLYLPAVIHGEPLDVADRT